MLIGYARTSTLDQVAGLEDQIEKLKASGCDKVYQEQVSSVKQRDELNQVLDFIRENDVLVITTLSRLARSTKDLLSIMEKLESKGASLKILDMDIDTSSAIGKMLLTVVASIATMEREQMLERQKIGIQKNIHKFKGRQPTARKQTDKVIELLNAGKSNKDVAAEAGISIASLYRIKSDLVKDGPKFRKC